MKKFSMFPIIVIIMLVIITIFSINYNLDKGPEKFTVQFIDNKGDTTYLLNSKPIDSSLAIEIAGGWIKQKLGEAQPVLWDSIWGKK